MGGMASSFEQEPITARRTVSPELLRESRNRPSARPTMPVPTEIEVERDSSGGFRVREINASRTTDPRSE